MGLVFVRLGRCVQRMCIVLHFQFCTVFQSLPGPNDFVRTKPLTFIHLSLDVIPITRVSHFGAASASFHGNKEAANSSTMTFTLSPRHFPNRSGWRNGVLYRLS